MKNVLKISILVNILFVVFLLLMYAPAFLVLLFACFALSFPVAGVVSKRQNSKFVMRRY